MTDKTIEMRGNYDDYFKILCSRKSKIYLNDIIDYFSFDDYHCYKRSGKQREVRYDSLVNMEYSGYILFRKDKYNKEHINVWINYSNDLGGIRFLDKKLPQFHPSKIIIKQ